MKWTLERLKKVSIAPRLGRYKAIATSIAEIEAERKYPRIFNFEAISIGDETGQAFLVPMDDSGEETAKLIIKAIQQYNGNK